MSGKCKGLPHGNLFACLYCAPYYHSSTTTTTGSTFFFRPLRPCTSYTRDAEQPRLILVSFGYEHFTPYIRIRVYRGRSCIFFSLLSVPLLRCRIILVRVIYNMLSIYPHQSRMHERILLFILLAACPGFPFRYYCQQRHT